MPRPSPAAAQEWAAAYGRGESTAAIAAGAQVDRTTVQRALRSLGVQMRPRGVRSAVSERDILRERGDDPDPPGVVTLSRRLGASRTAVTHAMRRAGITPTVGVPMTAAQTRRLAGLARKTPSGRGAHYDFRSPQGQRLLVEIGRLVDLGVHPDEIGMVVGVTGVTVRRWMT
ncbi:MAG TPA: hypothetical protein VIU11_18785 [Nakamurella sp.]